jgi:hypothetical protein
LNFQLLCQLFPTHKFICVNFDFNFLPTSRVPVLAYFLKTKISTQTFGIAPLLWWGTAKV